MPKVFDYTDYRKFLADFYAEKKRHSPRFSYQGFSRKAGFSSKSFVFNVIRGRKNISKSSILNLCGAMGLSATESAYFENLVSLNQAGNFKERDYYYRRLDELRPATAAACAAKRIREDQYEFYSNWYTLVLRSLLEMAHFAGDFKALANMVHPAITAKQAKNSVALLERLGFVENKGGRYKVKEKTLATDDEVQSLAVLNFQLKCLELAANALRELPKNRRNITGLTLGISRKSYEKICKMICAFQNEILRVAEQDKEADRVFQLNFQLFPMTKTGAKGN